MPLILSSFTQELTVSPRRFRNEGRSAFLLASYLATLPAAPLCITTPAQALPSGLMPPFWAAIDSGRSLSARLNNLGDTLAGMCPQFLFARICLASFH